MKKNTALLLILISFSSCSLAYRVLLGVDITPEWETNEEIVKGFDHYRIPENQRFVLDTASYIEAVYTVEAEQVMKTLPNGEKEIDSVKLEEFTKIAKDNDQPTQIRYFDSIGNPIFKLVNCYLDESPVYKIDWNLDGCFDVFPPQLNNENLKKGNENLDFFLTHIKRVDGSTVTMDDLPKEPYYAVLFWNTFFKRPSKKLIKEIQHYTNEHGNTFVLYVNNQNSEIWSLLSTEQKNAIKTFYGDNNDVAN